MLTNYDYDPDTWRGLFEDIVVLAVAIAVTAAVVVALWYVIGWAISALVA